MEPPNDGFTLACQPTQHGSKLPAVRDNKTPRCPDHHQTKQNNYPDRFRWQNLATPSKYKKVYFRSEKKLVDGAFHSLPSNEQKDKKGSLIKAFNSGKGVQRRSSRGKFGLIRFNLSQPSQPPIHLSLLYNKPIRPQNAHSAVVN